MKRLTPILYFLAAAAIVIMLGSLAGWYVFVRNQVSETQAVDAARGFSTGGGIFGNNTADSNFGTPLSDITDATPSTSTPKAKQAPRLWQVSPSPVAGYSFIATTSVARFADGATGNLFTVDQEQSAVDRLTATLYPKLQDALFTDESVVLRWSEGDTITTVVGKLPTTTPERGKPASLTSITLASNIAEVALLPAVKQTKAKQALLLLIPESTGGASVVQSDTMGGAQKKIFTSPLRGWHIDTTTGGAITLTQKTTDSFAGFSYALSLSGTLQPLETNLPGLEVNVRDGGGRLYSTSSGTPALFSRLSNTAEPIALSVATIADKCVWAPGQQLIAYCAVPQNIPGAQFLTNRDQGAAHSSDAWYRINATNGTAELFFTPNISLSLDVENPTIDASGTYILFRNAADRSLWMLRLVQ